MKYILILFLLLLSCQPDTIYIDKPVNPGLLELHNQLFDGVLHIKTDGQWQFADTLYTLDWFLFNGVQTFSLNEGGYRVELIHEGVGRYSSGALVFRDSTVVKIIQ